ncbi:MAG: class I SAM-dependent methyltransferase [Armatimonas sp.]
MTAAYDAIADWYDKSVRKGVLVSADDLIASELFRSIGGIEGKEICDLACGQGIMARQIAAQGASVVCVDLSQRLLDIAQAEEAASPRGITYIHEDAQSLVSIADTSFDGVLCNMALMDIPDLVATLRAVRRILRPGGWLAFTITHPCFQIPPTQGYFEEGFWRSDNPSGVRGQVGAHHRTLSTYLNALSEAGLALERISEPQLAGRDVPVVLAALCRRAG